MKINPAFLITLLLNTYYSWVKTQLHTISQFKSVHGIFVPVVKCIDNLQLLNGTCMFSVLFKMLVKFSTPFFF